jgi:elongation factor P
MAAISTSDIKNGITLVVENGLFTVIEFQHVKPGKGGAFVRTKLRNSRTGAVIERTYRSDERLEQAIIDKRDTQFLYRDGDDYIFMDQSTYDQVPGSVSATVSSTDAGSSMPIISSLCRISMALPVSSKGLGEASNFLKETGKAMLILHNDEIIGIELPASVELTVAETEPGIQGDRVSGARKPATLETGFIVQVPLFVGPGETIKVDTRTGEYMTRA